MDKKPNYIKNIITHRFFKRSIFLIVIYILIALMYFNLKEEKVHNNINIKNNNIVTTDKISIEPLNITLLNSSLSSNPEFKKENTLIINKKINKVTKKIKKVSNKKTKKKKHKKKNKKKIINTKKYYYNKLPGSYSDNLYWLSHIIYAEGGSEYCSDELQLLIGSVVLNRINSDKYPNTMYGVIFQSGQYQPTWSGSIYNEPDSRTISNAKILLENGPINENIVFQAEFSQGSSIYKKIDMYANGNYISTMYFCY